MAGIGLMSIDADDIDNVCGKGSSNSDDPTEPPCCEVKVMIQVQCPTTQATTTEFITRNISCPKQALSSPDDKAGCQKQNKSCPVAIAGTESAPCPNKKPATCSSSTSSPCSNGKLALLDVGKTESKALSKEPSLLCSKEGCRMSKNAQAMKFVESEKEPSKVEPMSSNEAAITSKIEPKPSKVDPMPSKLDPMPSNSSDSLSKVMKSAPIFNIFSDIPAEGDKYESSQEVQGHTSTIKEFQPVVNIYTDVHEVTDLKEHVKDNHQPENNDLLVHNLGDTHFNLLPEGVTDLCETLADVQRQIGAIKEFQPVVNIYTDVDEGTDLKEDNTPRAMNHHPHLQSNTHLNLLPKELTYLGTTSVEKNDSQDKADTAPKNVVVDQIVDKSSNGASTKGVAKEPTEASSNKTEDATVEIEIQMASVEGNKVVAEKNFSNVAMDEVMSDKAPSSAEPVVQEVSSYAVPIVPEENKKEELSSTEAMFEMS